MTSPFHDRAEGNPANEILTEVAAWGANLIVSATRGRIGLERALLGSVADKLMGRAISSAVSPTPRESG
jgi:nucleotide-binding universal stress UspA family protein